DYKLLSGTLAARIARVAQRLILPEQAAFIKGRHIGEHMLLVQGVLQSYGSGAVLFLDQEEYDRVDWSFLYKALAAYGFGPWFRNAIATLYHDTQTSVLINGWESNRCKIRRSLRQGDPSAPLLYDLLDNVVAAALLGDARYRGFS